MITAKEGEDILGKCEGTKIQFAHKRRKLCETVTSELRKCEMGLSCGSVFGVCVKLGRYCEHAVTTSRGCKLAGYTRGERVVQGGEIYAEI